MKEFVRIGEMVEGAKCDICARFADWKGLREDPITNQPMSVYELDRNCSVKVIDPIDLTSEEKAKRDALCVHGKPEDKLIAEAITVYINCIRKQKFQVKEGVSGRHGAMLMSTKVRTIGVIKYPLSNLVTALSNNQQIKIEK